MKIYIVHTDAIPEDKYFHDLSNKEIEEMYNNDPDNVDCYESIEELVGNWNSDEIFYPNMSYMRVVND